MKKKKKKKKKKACDTFIAHLMKRSWFCVNPLLNSIKFPVLIPFSKGRNSSREYSWSTIRQKSG
jgi:hypothetical protein